MSFQESLQPLPLPVIIFIFFLIKHFNSRLIILIAWLVSIIILVLARYILKKIQVALLKRVIWVT